MGQHDVPGMAVGVTIGGRQHVFSYGVASRETKNPVTPDTLFEIGSVSKPFTATLLGYAQALGQLSLDDRIGKHLPELRGSAIDTVSLLNLATYTAGGLPLQFPAEVANATDLSAFLKQWKPSAAPGTQRRYSNPSIGLAGHVAATAMKRPFADLMEKELLPKLGLSRSYIRVPAGEAGRYAWGYRAEKPVRVTPGVLAIEAYGVKSTATDMLRFVEANLRPETLDGPTRRAVEGTHVGYFRVGEMVQGLGWEQYPYPVPLEKLLAGNSTPMTWEPQPATELKPPNGPSEPTLFNKTGSTNGFSAYVAFVPARRIGIVMLANRNVPAPARIAAAHAVLEQLSPEPGK
jgi:beta-lactamase class C